MGGVWGKEDRNGKAHSKIHKEYKNPRIANTILGKKMNLRTFNFPISKPTIELRNWHKDAHTYRSTD